MQGFRVGELLGTGHGPASALRKTLHRRGMATSDPCRSTLALTGRLLLPSPWSTTTAHNLAAGVWMSFIMKNDGLSALLTPPESLRAQRTHLALRANRCACEPAGGQGWPIPRNSLPQLVRARRPSPGTHDGDAEPRERPLVNDGRAGRCDSIRHSREACSACRQRLPATGSRA